MDCGDVSDDRSVDLKDLVLTLPIMTEDHVEPNISADCNQDQKIVKLHKTNTDVDVIKVSYLFSSFY